jgi:hypothetical protein
MDWGFAVSDAGETLHLHNADAAGRGLEPDPVQPVGLHAESIRYAWLATPLPCMCGHAHVCVCVCARGWVIERQRRVGRHLEQEAQ